MGTELDAAVIIMIKTESRVWEIEQLAKCLLNKYKDLSLCFRDHISRLAVAARV